MKSTKCYECGFVGWSDAEFCKKCGAVIQQRSADADVAYESQRVKADRGPGSQGLQHGELKKGLAIASLVVGIISFMTLGLAGIGAAVGITLGIVAIAKANRYPTKYGGKGMATAGLVSSILSLVIVVPIGIIAAIAIPNLLAARRAANEGASISVLRRISAAESTYQAQHETYGDLEQLASEGLIDPELVSRPHYGYRFTISEHSDPVAFEATGVPVLYPSGGIRSFYIDETGVIRAADKGGAEATKLDSPLRTDSYSSSPNQRASD